jgi:hypothetical protein
MKVIEIGEFFDQEYISRIDYLSDDYFLDADILIMDINTVKKEFVKLFKPINEPIISNADYILFMKNTKERNTQLHRYLNNGGNLFVFPLQDNSITFKIIEDAQNNPHTFDFFNTILLEDGGFQTQKLKGQNIIYPNPLFEEFFKIFDCYYEFIYTQHQGYPIAKIKNTNQTIAITVPYSRGNVILLPKLQLYAEDYDDYRSRVRKARTGIIALDEALKINKPKLEEIKLPDWCSDYQIGNENIELNKLQNLQIESAKIQNSIMLQQQVLEKYDQLKVLLAGTGKQLEFMIEEIFTELGYEILPRENNRDDLIVKHESDVMVMEIKGVKGSAAEKNASQLMKWVTTYYSEHDVNPKGILIVNAFKDKPLVERTERIFPDQMMKYCTRMELCLVTTTQLLAMYLDFKAGLLTFEAFNNLLLRTIGEINYQSLQIRQINLQ